MITRIFASLLVATTLAPPAAALEVPHPGRQDSRIRSIAYSPNQVVDLYAAVGATLTIQFGDDESIAEVALSDTADLKHAHAANILWLKATAKMDTQPISVRTLRTDGTSRLYAFQWQTRDGGNTVQTPNVFYIVRFTYPLDSLKTAQTAEKKASDDAEAARAAQLLKATSETTINRRYVGQGDRALEPAIWDDGNSTFLRFAGNMRVPTVYVLNPDGKEAVAPYTVEGEIVTLHQTSRGIRLRDGDLVLCIWNQAWTPSGHPTGTGTTSPVVRRTLTDGATP
jgi:type IV secretion system protein VirB9